MDKALRDHKSLLRPQIHRAIFKIDNKMAFQDKEELIVAIVFVPVILTLHHPQTNNRIIHLTQCLVVPLVLAGFHQRRNIHQSQRREFDVQKCRVWIRFRFIHKGSWSEAGCRGNLISFIYNQAQRSAVSSLFVLYSYGRCSYSAPAAP